MGLTVADVVELPKKSEGVCVCDCISCKTDSCDNCELGEVGRSDKYTNGELCHERCCCDDTHDKLLSEISSLPLSPEKVVGMVEIDRERVAKIILEELDHEDTWSDLDLISCEKYKRCFIAISKLASDAIISNKSKILGVKGKHD